MKKIDLRNFVVPYSPYIFGLLVVGAVVIFQYGFYLLQFIGYPLGYGADGLFTMAIAKMYSENGIIFGSYTEQLNYPYSASLDAWYPVPEKLIYYPFGILVKLFGVYSATNLIQLITHIFSALGFIFAARYMGVNRKYAFLGGVVYGLTPFIFSRGLAHLTVGAAWFVPMMSVVILKLMERLEARSEIESKLRWIAICCAVLGAGLSPYYSFMFGQFLGFILLISLFKKQFDFTRFILLLIALMAASFFILNIANIANIFIYRPASIRNLAALEVYGLKLPELFLPAGFNRLKGLAGFAQQNYYLPAFVKGELWSPYLGLVGVFSCIYFAGSMFYQHFINNKKILNPMLLQALWITLYSLIGGVNLIAGVIGFQFIRATNRYSIWLLAIFLLYSTYRISDGKFFNRRYVYLLVTVITFVLIWVDLPPAYNESSRREIAQKVIKDREIIALMEREVSQPKILTLPAQVFPENGPINKMLDYEHMRFYLNSDKVKISYGGVKLDPTTPIQNPVNNQDIKEGIFPAINEGYNFVSINKAGYHSREIKDLIKFLEQKGGGIIYDDIEYIIIKIQEKEVPSKPILLYLNGWSQQEPELRWAIKNKASLYLYCTKTCKQEKSMLNLSLNIQSYVVIRQIKISSNGKELWQGNVDGKKQQVNLQVNKEDYDKEILISASGIGVTPGGGDHRKILFNISDVQIR